MQAVAATLLCITHLAAIVLGQSQTNVFVNPPPATNPARVAGSFIVGSSLNVVWSTKGRSLDLFIQQILPNGNSSDLQYLPSSRGLQSTTEFLWKIDFSGRGGNPNFDLEFSPTFYFGIVESGATAVSTLSQEVNFTSNVVTSSESTQTPLPSSTSALASSTTPISTSAPRTTTTVTDSSSLPTSTISSGPGESNSGLSSSTKTGLGVGIGVGVIGLIAGFGAGYWFFKRKKTATQQKHPEQMYIESPPYVAQSGQWTSGVAPPAPKLYDRSELQ
ncbi:hypothetical protein IFR05_013211 [Cadophora sp. M221]|nr:hypothetical protein IFR05_013211 [Cadophora sp. M221]